MLFALHMYDLVCNLSCTISDNVPGFLVMQCVSKRVFSDTLLRDIPMSISGQTFRGCCTRNDMYIFWMHSLFPKM